MRSFSFISIILLCLAILLVDILAFYWLKSITNLIDTSLIGKIIHTAFWVFTIGLIAAILLLRSQLQTMHPYRKQLIISSLYGLTVASFVPKIIFVIVFSTLHFSHVVITQQKSIFLVPLIGLFSGIVPFFVIVYGIFKAVYRFKIYSVSIQSKLLPKSFSGMRIVQISDLHLGSFNFRYHILERAVKTINNLNPDFIFITGDLVNNFAWELKGWQWILKKLKAKKGKYAVLGNHDYGDYSFWTTEQKKQANFNLIKHFFQKIDFKLLLNECEIIQNGTDAIAIAGVENWGKPPFNQYGNLKQALQCCKVIPFKILLSHDPSHWEAEVRDKADVFLTFSGHTHGMQAGYSYKKLQWSPIQYKYKYWAGLYQFKQQYLYVNRGLGWLGFPGRLGMRPEITCLDLIA